MMTTALHLKGGLLYDPANGIDGQIQDLFIVNGKMTNSLPTNQPVKVLDITGNVVMPGGIEMHTHIASPATTAARMIQSTAAYAPVVPTALQTGQRYASLGYTTAIEAAVPPVSSDYAHLQLDAIPYLDTGLLTLMGNHEAIIAHLAKGDKAKAKALIAQILKTSRSFGIKAVNPAGVSRWRQNPTQHRIESLDDTVGHTPVTPRTVLTLLAQTADELELSHPVHVHGPQLGEAGNVTITREMIQSLDGQRAHLAHLQYYCYGKTKNTGVKSAVPDLLNQLAQSPRITADLGLVSFGPAMTATADLPLEYKLYQQTSSPTRPAFFSETFNEDCFGVMPLTHQPHKAAHALQWAIGLELALLWDDPWRYALTVDHPNGGSFMHYPQLIALLMNKPFRDEQLARCHRAATEQTGLKQIQREMTLYEIAIITRAAPAKALGLKNKGHLGPNADADVAVYANLPTNAQVMFESPRYVIKAGKIILDRGSLALPFCGQRLSP